MTIVNNNENHEFVKAVPIYPRMDRIGTYYPETSNLSAVDSGKYFVIGRTWFVGYKRLVSPRLDPEEVSAAYRSARSFFLISRSWWLALMVLANCSSVIPAIAPGIGQVDNALKAVRRQWPLNTWANSGKSPSNSPLIRFDKLGF